MHSAHKTSEVRSLINEPGHTEAQCLINSLHVCCTSIIFELFQISAEILPLNGQKYRL